MSVDVATVERIARLARLALDKDEVICMKDEINAMLRLVSRLDEVDVSHVAPFSSTDTLGALRMREDVVKDGNMAEAILQNAPLTEESFFLVPKIVE